MREKLAKELMENLEKANADPEGADEKDFERIRKVEPVPKEEDVPEDDAGD